MHILSKKRPQPVIIVSDLQSLKNVREFNIVDELKIVKILLQQTLYECDFYNKSNMGFHIRQLLTNGLKVEIEFIYLHSAVGLLKRLKKDYDYSNLKVKILDVNNVVKMKEIEQWMREVVKPPEVVKIDQYI